MISLTAEGQNKSITSRDEDVKKGRKTSKSNRKGSIKESTPNNAKRGKNQISSAAGVSGAAAAAEGTNASKSAKLRLKNLQSKKSNIRLAKLEKMYQELTDIE